MDLLDSASIQVLIGMYRNHTSISTDRSLADLLIQYNKVREPISVSFRKIVDWLPNPDRATHLIHPYPAKLLMHIPHFFLANSILSKPGDVILDPFCGTGTVLLESLLSGRNAVGADSNPLARQISRVKTFRFSDRKLKIATNDFFKNLSDKPIGKPPDVVNLCKWFPKKIIYQLTRILDAIKGIQNQDVKEFFFVCFSKCMRSVSLADPRLSVPVRLRPDKYPEDHWFQKKAISYLTQLDTINVVQHFLEILKLNSIRMKTLRNILEDGVSAKVICSDARNLIYEFPDNGKSKRRLPDGSIQLVITSPPYVGAQKYIRSSSLSLGWLELCLSKELVNYEKATIGREHYPKKNYSQLVITGIPDADKILKEIYLINPLRAHIAAIYLNEMREALKEIVRVLKPGGYLVLVMGNNHICGMKFKAQNYLKEILTQLGMDNILQLIDDIRSRGLMTKRNKTASIITREWISIYQQNR